MISAISVEVFPGVLQTEQKYIGKWREAIETEMNIKNTVRLIVGHQEHDIWWVRHWLQCARADTRYIS